MAFWMLDLGPLFRELIQVWPNRGKQLEIFFKIRKWFFQNYKLVQFFYQDLYLRYDIFQLPKYSPSRQFDQKKTRGAWSFAVIDFLNRNSLSFDCRENQNNKRSQWTQNDPWRIKMMILVKIRRDIRGWRRWSVFKAYWAALRFGLKLCTRLTPSNSYLKCTALWNNTEIFFQKFDIR